MTVKLDHHIYNEQLFYEGRLVNWNWKQQFWHFKQNSKQRGM